MALLDEPPIASRLSSPLMHQFSPESTATTSRHKNHRDIELCRVEQYSKGCCNQHLMLLFGLLVLSFAVQETWVHDSEVNHAAASCSSEYLL